MKVPYINRDGNVEEIRDSRDLTSEEWALVKANRSGVLSQREIDSTTEDPS